MTTTYENDAGEINISNEAAAARSTDLKACLEFELRNNCHRKVTRRLALRLAHAVIEEDRKGMFLAERLANKLRPRLVHEVNMRDRNLEREVM